MAALKVTGITLATLIGVLLLVLSLPVTLKIAYSEGGFSASLRIFFLKFRIFPMKPKRKTKKQRDRKLKTTGEPKEKKKDTAKEKKKISFSFIRLLIPPAKKLLKTVFRSIRIHAVKICIPVSGGDASKIGLTTGRIWSAIGILAEALEGVFKIRYKSVRVVPDFSGMRGKKAEFGCKITVFPVIIVTASLVFLFRYIKLKNSDVDTETQANERTTVERKG